jgi:hypothetical protein
VSENGYLRLVSAPRDVNHPLAYTDIRTIEIDYDAYANIGGIDVPNSDTYLGTLRFKLRSGASLVNFAWHESKAVITTDGRDITDDGVWKTIPNVLLYDGRIVSPNGGESYPIMSSQVVKFNTTKSAKVYIEFSSNSGLMWSRLTDTAIVSAVGINELT